MKIGLVAEVTWEVREVCKQLDLKRLQENHLYTAMLNGHEIWLCLSGMVPSIARERVERFLDSTALDLMICSGLAGALQPHLAVADVVVQSGDEVLSATVERAIKEAGVPVHVGPLVTVGRPILTPEARRELRKTTGAVAVDMESQTIAELCRKRGIPCLAIKAISDGIEDDLSPILGGVDVIHIPSLAVKVLTRPHTWPLAARLAVHSRRAATNLGRGVFAALQSLGALLTEKQR